MYEELLPRLQLAVAKVDPQPPNRIKQYCKADQSAPVWVLMHKMRQLRDRLSQFVHSQFINPTFRSPLIRKLDHS